MRLCGPYKFASPSPVVQQFWVFDSLWQLWGCDWATSSDWRRGNCKSWWLQMWLRVVFTWNICWGILETSTWLHGTSGRPSESEDCQDVWKVSFKKNGEGPWHVHKRSWKNWIVFQSLLVCWRATSFFMYVLVNWINDGLPEKQIRQQCLWLCSLPTVEGLGGADCCNDFPKKNVLQWTLGLSWSFECFCFLLHYLIVNTHGRFSKLSPNYGHSLLQSEAVEEMELYIVDNDLGQKPELRIAISKNNVYLLKTFSLRFGQV